MKLTSAAAAKAIKTLEDRKSFLLSTEVNDREYVQAEDEKADIPEYSFTDTNQEIDQIDLKIRTIKHALNVFNTTTVLASGQTIDESLVEMAQLNQKLPRLSMMRSKQRKRRLNGMETSRRDVAEFENLNYDPKEVEKVYEENMKRVQQIQLALDKVNQTVEFEVEVEL